MHPPSSALFAVALAIATSGCQSNDSRSSHQGGGSTAAGTARLAAAVTPRSSSSAPPTDSISAMADRGRIQGNAQAPLWIIEASDFQCPFCKTWHDSTYAPLVDNYVKTGKVRMAYLNFPLNQHQNALPAAEAAMCASVQDKFWPMHDALFNDQAHWQGLQNALPVFDSLAAKLGVVMPAWRECVTKHLTRPLIEADYTRSQTAGVKSTPTFFVGDQLLTGAQPYAFMRQIIEAQLAKRPAGR